MKSIIEGIRWIYEIIVETIKKRTVLGYLSLAPAVACALSFLFALIHWLRFAFSRGYQPQASYLKVLDFGHALTTGTVPDYYNGIFCIVLGVLLLIGIVAGIIEFFREEKRWRKVLTIVTFSLGIACFGLALADGATQSLRGVGFIPEQVHEPFRKLMNDKMALYVFLTFAGLALMIGVIVLLWTSDSRELFANVLIATLVSFAGVPLILLLFENLVAWIIVGILIVGIPLFILFEKFVDLLGMFSGDSGTASGSGGSVGSGSYGRSVSTQKVSPMEKTENTGVVTKDGKIANVRLSNNYKLVIHDGKVYGRNVQAGSEYFIWNEEAFKSGEWKIFDTNSMREIRWEEVEKIR